MDLWSVRVVLLAFISGFQVIKNLRFVLGPGSFSEYLNPFLRTLQGSADCGANSSCMPHLLQILVD